MALLGTAPHSVTLPSCAVTSIAPEGSFESGASSVCFTLAASSLFGSGFGGSGFTSGVGAGLGISTAFATGLGGGGGGGSEHAAAKPSARPSARIFLIFPPLSPDSVSGEEPRCRIGVEPVLMVAHLVSYYDFALLGKDRFDFLPAKAAQHVLHFILIVRTVVLHGVQPE